MAEQITQPVPPLVRLHKASVVLQMLAAHPEVAAAPINWEINDRPDDLWGNVAYGSAEAEASARTLAAALGVEVLANPVQSGRVMFEVYGHWAGVPVSLQVYGPAVAAAGEVAA